MKMIIDGKKVDSFDGSTIPVVNPATHKVIDSIPNATEKDVRKAIDVAKKGKKIWAAYTPSKRAEILFRVAELLRKETHEIAKIICQEEGKIYSEAVGEVTGNASIFEGYASKMRHYYGSILPRINNDFVEVIREPLGIVVCIIPYNFPADLYCHKVAPALAAGNAVIVKPSSETPLANIYMTDLLLRACVPAETIQIVTGYGADIGKWFSTSNEIDAINLTGSTNVGIQPAKNAATHLKKVFLELGGNDPFIVLDDADLDLAVEETVINRMLNAGQTCCAPKRFIVHNSLIEEYTDKVVERLSEIKQGNPMDLSIDMGPMVSEHAAEEIHRQVTMTINQGAKCVLGGELFDKSFYKPTVLIGVTKDMDIAKDMEVFGPVIPIIGFDTEEEAIDIANQSIYGLSAGVITKDWKRGVKLASKLDSGTVAINGSGLCRTADMPFGGRKMSGTGGGEGFFNTLDEMHNIKTILLKDFYN